jgi:hypothetical protein
MLSKITTRMVAGIAALGVAATFAAPAQAFGQRERDVLKGVAIAVVADKVLENIKRQERKQQAYQQPRYFVQPQTRYVSQPQYVQRSYTPRRVATPSAIYSTPSAQAFNTYTPAQRRDIQTRLATWGYYDGGADGSFGPKTHSAVIAYARDTNGLDKLDTVGGVYTIYETLIR